MLVHSYPISSRAPLKKTVELLSAAIFIVAMALGQAELNKVRKVRISPEYFWLVLMLEIH